MIFAANWKMNLSVDEAKNLASALRDLACDQADETHEIVIFPPALYGMLVNDACQDSPLSWGGQACHQEASGAHTGDIAAAMFASAGAKWQLVGHSERRTNHQESDAQIAQQMAQAHHAGLSVVLCVGESLAHRQNGDAEAVVCDQLQAALGTNAIWDKIVIAYEPVWAIGTGQVASSQDVEQMHQVIADYCVTRLGAKIRPQILYGGSVKAENAAKLMALAHVDGALVGGASLKISDFQEIVKAAS